MAPTLSDQFTSIEDFVVSPSILQAARDAQERANLIQESFVEDDFAYMDMDLSQVDLATPLPEAEYYQLKKQLK